MKAIGHFRSSKAKKLEAPRQASLDAASSSQDYIELPKSFAQAVQDLESFSHIWVIFEFHESKSWRALIQPPRGADRKVGVFASRAPYRPNNLGLSALRIVRIEKADHIRIYVAGSDLLDGTPILDIKPYVASFDSVPDATNGWMKHLDEPEKSVRFVESLKDAEEFLEKSGIALSGILNQQLGRSPFANFSKRVRRLSEDEGLFAYRLWRVKFQVRSDEILVFGLFHVYSEDMEKPRSLTEDEIEIYRNFSSKFAGADESSTRRPLA